VQLGARIRSRTSVNRQLLWTNAKSESIPDDHVWSKHPECRVDRCSGVAIAGGARSRTPRECITLCSSKNSLTEYTE